ncbi:MULTISPECIES: BrnT family toxin [unclassified Mesorhizobium]|uniref:BrnT family toxin n=1 Tax=unclassified Mesorhizobium TaxID=325217 RepID=UPI000FCBDFFE|nr:MULTISPECIES: BrnT family toxin [unclassified Mesorhizobium]RUW34272.1 BrnT family toxin [Mesorhizobium sp. M1E.F.Ca.ET.041.01.1.1]RWB54175.1 MAG: BrnT family toxin [Mesorhizobium sp.]RWD80685.1 MAG: BrnT family toxin [Mesorhizobium sp.]RWD85662.1 MAG: BrnT family toxin [Mesorhizobium sp.]TIV49663.1 MAG: BrnT family toxin [Mesorhizobium sp.]
MQFEWDPEKARRNLAKHGVAFDLALKVFDDPLHLIVPDRFEDGEQRWHAIGMVGIQVILLVVHTYPDLTDEERVRIVGARKATPHERRRYEQEEP